MGGGGAGRLDGCKWGEGTGLDSHLIVVGRELMEQLLDAVLLSWTVHIRHLVLRQAVVVLMDLRKTSRG